MIRVVHLPSQPSEEQIAPLAGAVLYHSDILHGSHQALRLAGLDPKPIPQEGIEGDAILVIPKDLPRTGPVYDVVQLMDRLLAPGGCPWDQAQTHESLKRCLIEEAYEVLDAIDSGDESKLIEELGDLLLQPIMHAQIAAAAGRFGTDTIAEALLDKLIRRHPHVFGDAVAEDSAEVLKNWEKIKRTEKGGAPRSILAGVPIGMASLLRAHEVSKRAARNGFEWPDLESVWDKLHEEERELREAILEGNAPHVESEVGDLLFTAVNIARWVGVEPEEALRKMLNRFTQRFMRMESLTQKELRELSFDEWDALWEQAKRELRDSNPEQLQRSLPSQPS